MKVSYDKKNDTAYIDLGAKRWPNDVAVSYTCDAQQINAIINLEFGLDGRLLGLEVLDAKDKLSQELLENAKDWKVTK